MQKTLGLFLHTCSRVFKNREGSINLFHLSIERLKVPSISNVHWGFTFLFLGWEMQSFGNLGEASTMSIVSCHCQGWWQCQYLPLSRTAHCSSLQDKKLNGMQQSNIMSQIINLWTAKYFSSKKIARSGNWHFMKNLHFAFYFLFLQEARS